MKALLLIIKNRSCVLSILNNSTKVKSTLRLLATDSGNSSNRIVDSLCTNSQRQRITDRKINLLTLASCTLGFVAFKLYGNWKYVHAEATQVSLSAGEFRKDLPTYSLDDVSKHTTKEDGIWLVFKRGVYDVTDFIEGHPGGDQILMAAGNSVEPFWMLYNIHYNAHVLEILESLRIGNLSEDDTDQTVHDMTDPYGNEPKRLNIFKIASEKPFNAETPETLLVESFITPNELFYIRNHLPVPEIDPDAYELEIEVEGKSEVLTFSLQDLKQLPKCTITATIMCAGNRRSEMMKVKPVKGLNWGAAAVGNATWTGVRLRDILIKAGVDADSDHHKHIQFEAYDTDVSNKSYGASIPFWKGIDKRGDVILAYEMNGVPIPRDHGYPVRVIVPGVVGARNVKWLGKIIVSKEESDSHWQQNDYKGFSPSTDWDTVDFTKSPAIQELPVISAICKPLADSTVEVIDDHIIVKGYAWSGGGQKIVRVDITNDQGKTWYVADLDFQDTALPPQHWSWTLWSSKIPVPRGFHKMELWVKAVDSTYNTQPESFENIWNLRGVLNNAFHRISVNLS